MNNNRLETSCSAASLRLLALLVLCLGIAVHLAAEPNALVMALDELYAVAEHHNSSLQSARAAVEQAEAACRSARAERLPDVTAQLSLSYNGNGRVWDRDFTNGQSAPIPHFGNAAHLQASVPLYSGGAITGGITLAEQGKQMAALGVEETRSGVRLAVTHLYLALHMLGNRERVMNDNIALAERQTAVMRTRCQQGVALPNDVTRYELLLEQLRLGLTQVQHQRSIVSHQMARTLGIDTTVTILPDSTFATPAFAAVSDDHWLATAQENAHDLRRAALEVGMSRQREQLARAAMRPTVALVAEDHLTGPITIDIPARNNNFNYWWVGVGVSYKISSLFKDKHRVSLAQATTHTALAEQVATRDQVDIAVQQACVNHRTALAALHSHTTAVKLAGDNYAVVRNRYDNGLALVTDLLDAATEKLNAELQLVDATLQVIENYYTIKYISGTL